MPETKEAPKRIWVSSLVALSDDLENWHAHLTTEQLGSDEIEYIRKDVADAAVEQTRRDCLTIAQGCFDYGGGYRSDEEKMKIYHHGIQTVVNALTSFIEKGLKDTQVASLYRTGCEAAKEK